MTLPTLSVELGRLTGWQLGVEGASELGVTTELATYEYEAITSRVLSASIRRGRQHELDRIEAGVASLTLINQDGAFNAANTASEFYPDIRPMIPLRIRATVIEPFVPTEVSGLIGWYDFADAATLFTDTGLTTPVSADGQIIQGVSDKSTANHDLTEATNGPTYKVAIKNGNSIARYDGTNDILTATVTETQPFTIIGVIQTAEAAGTSRWFFGNNATFVAGFKGGGTQPWTAWAGAFIDTAINADLVNFHTHITLANGASSSVYLDGGTADATGNLSRGAASNWSVGNPGANFWKGDICVVLVYDTNLSVADINIIGPYLATKWGITWTTAT